MHIHFCGRRLGPIVLLFFVLLSACKRDPNVRKRKFYETGIEYLSKGDSQKAALQLRNALQIDPKFAEAANVLAELEFRQHNYAKAYSLLQQAVAAKPDYLPAHRGLAQVYRLSGKLTDAQNELHFILDRSPDDIETLLSLGSLQAHQGKLKDAEGTLNRILELQPNHLGALLELAFINKEAQDLPLAERYYKAAVEKNPESIPAHLGLIKFYITTGRPAEAEPLFSEALRMSNNNILVLEAQAGYYEGLKKFAETEAVVRTIQASQGKDPKYWTVLADFYVRSNEWVKAQNELERLSRQHPDDPGILHKLIEVHMGLNDRKAAEALNVTLLNKNPKDSYGHMVKGRLYLADGDFKHATAEFNEAAKYVADSAALHYWLGQACIRQGDLGQAKQELATALRYDPNYRAARLSLTQIDSATGSVDQAFGESRTLAMKNPGDTEAMVLYCQSLIQKGNYATAEKVVKLLLERSSGSAQVHRLAGVLRLSHQDLPGARKEFKQAWELQPNSKALLESVVMGYFVAKQPAGAADFLSGEIQNRPNNVFLYQELGQVYLWQSKRSAAIPVLQKAIQLAPGDPDTTVLLADADVSEKHPDEAVRLITDALRLHPKDANLLLRCGMIFEKLGQWDDARGSYERALQVDGDNAFVKNNLAWLLTEHGGNIDVALKLAEEAKEKLYDNPQVTDTIGWVYYKKGVYKTARDYLKQSAEKDQKNATFQYQLGMVEWKLGNRDEARRDLLNAVSLDPKLPEAVSALSALARQ